MPLFFQQDIDVDTRLGVWKIEEDEAFFLREVMPQREVKHPHKRLQHLAGRYLLRYLFPLFPTELILIADTRKPFLEDEAFHFSISHCSDYAAAIVSRNKRVGVDIEVVTEKVSKIRHKFISSEEDQLLEHWALPFSVNNVGRGGEINRQLTLLWSCKEAMFKWYGQGEVDFREHMVLQKIKQKEDGLTESSFCFKKEMNQLLPLCSRFFEVFEATDNFTEKDQELVLSFVVT